MYKNILVCVDGGPSDEAVTNAGIFFAKNLSATLHGLTVQDILTLEGPLMYDISGSIALIPQMNFLDETRKALTERAKNILASFVSSCEKSAVLHHEDIAEGIVYKVINKKSELHDLTIMGRRGLNYALDSELLGSTTDRIIRNTQGPVMVITHEFAPIKKPLLAYDGSHEAKKAMVTTAGLCAELKLPLTVLNVAKKPEDSEELLREAKDYLSAYPLLSKYEHATGKPYLEVPQYAKRHGHDLLIMGARGHRGIIDRILGSTTEYALWSGNCHILVDR